jgi:NADPH:quinone reductase-like Zn-dependent oxidoreductase
LYEIARLRKGESILIHAATGGLGQASIMLAKHIGAEIFVTCGTETKRRLLIDRYHIDPSHIFSSRDASFAPGIMAKTNGKGVDVVSRNLIWAVQIRHFIEGTRDCVGEHTGFLSTSFLYVLFN